MRVLHVIPSVNPDYGGPVTAMCSFARAMAQHGWTAEALTLDPPQASWPATAGLPATGVGPGVAGPGFTRQIARWIVAHRHRFDAVVVHGLWTWASVGGGQGAKAAGLPYVVFPHGMLDPYFRRVKPFKHYIKKGFWLAQGPVLRDAYRVVFTAEEEARLARGGFHGPAYQEALVPLGADPPPAGARETRIAGVRGYFDLAPDDRYLLFLGRFHSKKGIDLMISAFAQALQDLPEQKTAGWRLVIAGPDPDDMSGGFRQQSQRLGINHRVVFPGAITGATKWGALEGAEALTLMTHQENHGLVLTEALAAGTPVITTDCTNIHGLLASTGAAIICQDQLGSATTAMSEFMSMKQEVKSVMRLSALAGYQRYFTPEKSAETLMALLTRAKEAACGPP